MYRPFLSTSSRVLKTPDCIQPLFVVAVVGKSVIVIRLPAALPYCQCCIHHRTFDLAENQDTPGFVTFQVGTVLVLSGTGQGFAAFGLVYALAASALA